MLFLVGDGKVVYASRKGAEALGICSEQPSYLGFEAFRMVVVAPECLKLSREIVRRKSRGEEVPAADYALLTRDGRRIEGVLTGELVEREGRRELLGVFRTRS